MVQYGFVYSLKEGYNKTSTFKRLLKTIACSIKKLSASKNNRMNANDHKHRVVFLFCMGFLVCTVSFFLLFKLIQSATGVAVFEPNVMRVSIFVVACGSIVFVVSKFDPFISSRNSYLYLAMGVFIAVLTLCTVAYLWYARGALAGLQISLGKAIKYLPGFDSNIKFMADGYTDIWAYILHREGIFNIPYNSIAVEQRGTSYLYAFIFAVVNDFNLYYLVVFNSLVKILTSILIFKIGLRFLDTKTAMLAAIFMCVLPEGIIWAGMIHKENIVILILMMILFCYYKVFLDEQRVYYSILGFLLFLIAFIRSGLLLPIILMGGIFAVIVKGTKIKRLALYLLFIFLYSVIFVSAFPPYVVESISRKVFHQPCERVILGSTRSLDVENISYSEDSLVKRFGEQISLRNIYWLPLRVCIYYITPFPPWIMRERIDWWIIPSTWMVMLVSPFAIFGLLTFLIKNDSNHLFIALSFIVVSVAVAFSGPWVLERYRFMAMPMFFLMAAYAWNEMSRLKRMLWLGAVPLLVLGLWRVYLMIKY